VALSVAAVVPTPLALAEQQVPSHSTAKLELPLTFERHLGDLDGMKKRHAIRVLVAPSHSGFFYDQGQPHGIYYEAFNEFQRFANLKLRPGAVKITVSFIPMRPEQLEQALREGVGDVVGYGVIVTPEREKEALFTTAIDSDVKEVIVTGPKAPAMTTLEDLSGKEVYVNPLTAYNETLQRLSKEFEKAGRRPILVRATDKNLTDEDLLEMVNAGLIPATVTINLRAEFWSKVLPRLRLQPNMVLKQEGQLAFVTRIRGGAGRGAGDRAVC
jgi:membrane-bound lytic murein transglycosylase MltF